MATRLTFVEALEKKIFQDSSCAIGVFDGVHIGHQYLIKQAIETAREKTVPSIVLTFDIDPDEMFHKNRLKKIMSNQDRIDMLLQSGVDVVVILPFDHTLASLSPDAFLDSTFGEYVPNYLHVGSDFKFGSRALGTVDDLRTWAKIHGAKVCTHDLKCKDGKPVTSTRIRLLLADGDLENAKDLLGHAYFLCGRVVHGRGEGESMGFATANIIIPRLLHTLSEGVYAAYVIIEKQRYRAAVSMGISPTFSENTDAECEVHILDFFQNIYDKEIVVEFVKYLRPMMKFDSREDLISQVVSNIKWVRDNL